MIVYYFSLHQLLIYILYFFQSYLNLLYRLHYIHFLCVVKIFSEQLVNVHIRHHIKEKMLDSLLRSNYIFYILLLLNQKSVSHLFLLLTYLLLPNILFLHFDIYLQVLKNNKEHIIGHHYLYY